MSNQIKNGKVPLSAKRPAKTAMSMDDLFGNPLTVDPSIAAAIDKMGMTHRWVGYHKLKDNGGYHERGWRPVKRSECVTMDSSIPSFGVDPDGYIRRGDLILAVRPKELTERHRAYLRQEAARGKQIQKKHADELRQHVRDAGLSGATIHEGYEDEGET